MLEEVELARGQERMFDADFRVQRPDGSIRWVHGLSLPLHQPDCTHDGFIHVIYEITDRKLIETQLRGSLETLKREGDEQIERLRKGVEATESALDELTAQLAEETEDHSLDDFLF